MNARGLLWHTTRLSLASALVLSAPGAALAWQALPNSASVPANQPAFTVANEAEVPSPVLSLALSTPAGETPIATDLVTGVDTSAGTPLYTYALVPRAPLTPGTTVVFHYPYFDGPTSTTYAVGPAQPVPSADAPLSWHVDAILSGSTIVDVQMYVQVDGIGDLTPWVSALDMRITADGALVSVAPRRVGPNDVSWNVPVDCGATGYPQFVPAGDRAFAARIGGLGVAPFTDARHTLHVDCTPTAYFDSYDHHELTPDEVAMRLGPQPDSGFVGPDAGASARDGSVASGGSPSASSGCSISLRPHDTRGEAWCIALGALALGLLVRRRR